MLKSKHGKGALATGGIAALLASTCCLGPLILVTLGFSGAWISNLSALEPYRPVFLGLALAALFFAYPGIFRSADDCKPGEICALPEIRIAYRLAFWGVVALVLAAFLFPYIAPLFY